MRATQLFLIFFAFISLAKAQFTLEREYDKQVKTYPFIQKATVLCSDSVRFIPDIVYTSERTTPLHVDLFLPVLTSTNLPVVLLVHGGGWESGDKCLDHPLASALARRGIAALCVQYSLSGTAPYPAAIQDICTAIRWTKMHAKAYGWCVEDITLLGSSAGGQLVSLIGSVNAPYPKFMTSEYPLYDNKVQRVIDIDGVQDFLHADSSESGSSSDKTTAASRWLGVHPSIDSTLWREASALNHVGAQSASFLYLLSSYPRFSAGYAEMMKALRSEGIVTAKRYFPSTPHSFWLFHPWFNEVVGLTEQWIRHTSLP